jgi:RHS repeat-associated protein
MKTSNYLTLSTSPLTRPARKPRLTTRAFYRKTLRRYTGKEQDSETGLHYYGARYLDSRTGRWLSGDPALGDYVPQAPVNEEAKKQNESLPGMGGVFNYANLHVYHYAGNNPVKYVDPDGNILRTIHSYSKMNQGAWTDTKLNANGALISSEGCAITGMANIATQNSVSPDRQGPVALTTPSDLNKSGNFEGKTDNLNWDATARSFGMSATQSTNVASEAQTMLKNADISPKNVSALALVPITTNSGDSLHWVGVDGGLVDLNDNKETWIKVSPTSKYDGADRKVNSNWKQGADGSMYVKLSAVRGAVIVE